MSVLCCRVPNFLINLTLRRRPEWAGKPLALLGPDERIWAVSETARKSGVQVRMPPRQAQMRCPDLLLQPADLEAGQNEQAALLNKLARWELPVEPLGWGLAYVDLASIARAAPDVKPLAVELGRSMRRMLGEPLQPSIGWDSGKFTARAAAVRTDPGRIRLVDKAHEISFLSPLPITLLPLEPAALQQLHWLGICTLGQFAALPATAVWQRFGQAGKLAQRWAQGRDERPVWNGLPPPPSAIDIDIDPPTGLLPPLVEAVMAALRPPLEAAVNQLQGWRRLRLWIRFVDAEERPVDMVFIEPVSDELRLREALSGRLAALNWPSEASFVRVEIQEVQELQTRQLTLFPDTGKKSVTPERIATRLCTKYGPIFFRPAVVERNHPAAERRMQLQPVP